MPSSPPLRTCVGCGRRRPKAELVRFVARDGVLAVDPAGRSPGRGAYTCPDSACFARAVQRRGFARTLRTPVRVPPGLQAVCEEG